MQTQEAIAEGTNEYPSKNREKHGLGKDTKVQNVIVITDLVKKFLPQIFQ